METSNRRRQPCGEDSGISDDLGRAERMVYGYFSLSPLPTLAFVRMDHVRPVKPVDLGSEDVLDKAELLIR